MPGEIKLNDGASIPQLGLGVLAGRSGHDRPGDELGNRVRIPLDRYRRGLQE